MATTPAKARLRRSAASPTTPSTATPGSSAAYSAAGSPSHGCKPCLSHFHAFAIEIRGLCYHLGKPAHVAAATESRDFGGTKFMYKTVNYIYIYIYMYMCMYMFIYSKPEI